MSRARPARWPGQMRAPRSLRIFAAWGFLLLPGVCCGQLPAAAETRRDVAPQSGPLSLPARESAAAFSATAPLPGARARGAETEFGEQRIVQRRAHVEPWSASAGVDLYHTDNAALTPANEQQDWYLRYGFTAAYTNRVKGPVFFDVSLQHYLFRYAEYDILDFDLTRLETGFLLQLPWLADSFFASRYRLEYLTEPGMGSALFTNHTVDLSLQKVWKISRGQQLFAGASANLALATDPGGGARDEYALSAGYSLRLTERLTAGLSYRGSYYRYREGERDDWNHIFAAGLTYDFTDWLRVGLNASYTRNISSAAFGDYENFVPGGGLLLRLAF